VPAALPLRHLLLALAVVAVWGSNFVVIKLALGHLPPLLFAALRFASAFLPAAFFVRPPAAGWRNVALYGALIGVGQFGLLYVAMDGHISPGIASLVIQVQVFFTIGLSIRLTGDRVHAHQWLALLLASVGILVIEQHTDGSTTLAGLLMVLAAALAWAGGNLTAKMSGERNLLAYVVWSSAYAVPVLVALSLVFEGPGVDLEALRSASWGTWAAIAWQGWGNTLFGFAAWAWLLARHPAAVVTPMALLVPVFGMSASTLLLGEAMPGWKVGAAGLVMGGLTVNLLWPRIRHAIARVAGAGGS
jgi:O-acetylserine/cysteine efflux transporter